MINRAEVVTKQKTIEAHTREELLPFVKWAGGKRWLWARYRRLFPASFNSYFEPFLGSGSIYWSMCPARAHLSDTNFDLINLYAAIRDEHQKVHAKLRSHSLNHSLDYYYKVRASMPRSSTSRAARLLYLNRTCWNGLYRVNRSGIFNVPKGTKDAVLLDSDRFSEWSERLSTASLYCGDFEAQLQMANEGDFVFIDPPYTTAHNSNGFVKYNEKIFTWTDQLRLRDAVIQAASRGALVLILNANHESVVAAYAGVGVQVTLHRRSVISGNEQGRRATTELAIVIGYRPTDILARHMDRDYQQRRDYPAARTS